MFFCVYIFIDYVFLLNSGLSFSKIAQPLRAERAIHAFLGWLKSRDVFQPSMNYLLFIPHNDIKRFLIGQPHGLLQRIFLTHVIDSWCDICPQIVHEFLVVA